MAMGRPKGKPRETSTLLRLSLAEREAMEREAGREPLATWARRVLLEHVERKRRARARKED